MKQDLRYLTTLTGTLECISKGTTRHKDKIALEEYRNELTRDRKGSSHDGKSQS